jgi:hypothetical protein
MQTLPANAEEVRIHNSENNTEYYFVLRTDRLVSFFQYLTANRASGTPSVMPGISGAAAYGLDCIFFGPKPPRFPARDILAWLTGRQEDPTVSVQEVEDALGRWAGTVTQLLADGTERA